MPKSVTAQRDMASRPQTDPFSPAPMREPVRAGPHTLDLLVRARVAEAIADERPMVDHDVAFATICARVADRR